MYKFGNVLIRQNWRNALACVNKRLIVNPPLFSTRALETCRLDGRVCGSQGNKYRCMSNSVKAEVEEPDSTPFGLIVDDIKDVYNEIIRMLRQNIRNTDMYNIANNVYHSNGDTSGAMSHVAILLNKALNYHMFKDATLTDSQKKAIAIVELLMNHNILHDDILDNASTRLGSPAAHKLWSSYQVVVTGNMLLGIAFDEGSKLKNDVGISLLQLHEIMQRGQFMNFKDVLEGDIWGHHFTTFDHKGASIMSYICKAAAQAAGSKKMLEDNMVRLGFNLGMFGIVIDDIADFEVDLKARVNSAPAIFATREYPELKEIMLRRFSEEGDVEKTIELVNKSQGFEEARSLARMYHRFTMSYVRLLADSPYKRALENVIQLILLRMEPGKGENFMLDV